MPEHSISGPISRRGFLQATAAGTAGWAMAASAADPVVRTGSPYFKLSLAAYSFHARLPRNWPKPKEGQSSSMTLLDFIDYCAKLDLDGTELTGYYFPNPLTSEDLLEVKQRTFRLGLDISGTAIGNDFCMAEGPARDAELARCREWIDFAATMGAPVIRIFAGKVPKGDSEEAARERCVAGITQSLEFAAKRGVMLALENHGGITATPEQLLAIVKAVPASPWFGVNFDSGNFKTDDPYRDLEKIAPYAVNAQIKVAVFPNNGPAEKTDFARVIDILKHAGYRGYVVLEYEDKHPEEEIPAYVATLRKLIG